MQGNATVVARPPEAGPKLPVRKIQEHATAAGDGEQTATRHDSITGTEWLATAPAPAPGSNNQFSRDYIQKAPLNELLIVELPIKRSTVYRRDEEHYRANKRPCLGRSHQGLCQRWPISKLAHLR